ncbi:alpha/beta fold hydrolase [Carnimonas nigrificans]|uniref:alpha/beta fold hydrolase n=1 Tax=Carnimonas nigrificans TaxID=64323 RepID=UPI00046EBB99|nr:alpha/beta hydrolase [Carnimonas nigrificans]
MASCYTLREGTLALSDQRLFWRRLSCAAEGRPLLLLHGAGVAGGLTWKGVVEQLQPRCAILIPDLRGAGRTASPEGAEVPFSASQVVDDLVALVDQQGFEQFDVAGYSFGGLMTMLLKERLRDRIVEVTLLEPGLLERADLEEMRSMRAGYQEAARLIRKTQGKEGIDRFLALIAPHRSRNPRVERIITARLAERPLGFANALDCVTEAIMSLDRAAILAAQQQVLSIVGGNSPHTLRDYHQQLARTQPAWRTVQLSGTDHSLPFQKPQHVARLIDRAE